jgi:heterotetrameric sarcosine oxidase gamma subunit
VTSQGRSFVAVAPFSGLAAALAANPGLAVADRDGLGLATVIARKGRGGELAARLRAQFDIELPQGPRRTTAGKIALIGTGPGVWLATHEDAGNAFAASLRSAVGALASISDQTDGSAVLRIFGPGVRETLAKLVSVDVHAREFAVGAAASTSAAHVGATLWRLDDGADGSPVFEIAVPRSLAGSFSQALRESV